MLGPKTLCTTSQYQLTGILVRPDLLSLQLIHESLPAGSLLYRDIDDRQVAQIFHGALPGVKELLNEMINDEKFKVIPYDSHFCIQYTHQKIQDKVIIPLVLLPPVHRAKNTCMPAKDDVIPQLNGKQLGIEMNQQKIQDKVANKIFDKLFNSPEFKNHIITRNQAKVQKLTQELREAKQQCEISFLEIQKLKKGQKQLREEVKNLRQQLKKYQLQTNAKQISCQNTQRIYQLEVQTELLTNMITTTNEELSYLQKIEKGYSGRKIQVQSEKRMATRKDSQSLTKKNQQKMQQNIRGRENLQKTNETKVLHVNENCYNFPDFSIKGQIIELKKNQKTTNPKNQGKQSCEWKYLYFDDILPANGEFSLQFKILQTVNSNISFGIVQQKFAKQRNCFNTITCIEYVCFSKQIYESGRPTLKAVSPLTNGDQISFQVNLGEGMLSIKNFGIMLISYESGKLRKFNKTNKYTFFIRMKDKEDAIQIITALSPLKSKQLNEAEKLPSL